MWRTWRYRGTHPPHRHRPDRLEPTSQSGPVALHRALVVEAQQRDRVFYVVVGLERARAVAGLAGKDRVVADPPLVEELMPDGLREADVQDAVAVQVADLPAAHAEAELSPVPHAGLDAGPRRGLGGDPLARAAYARRHAVQCRRVPVPVAIGNRS